MKKFTILTAAFLLSASLASAGDRKVGVPVAQTGVAVSGWDYAGVDRSTITFSSKNVLAFTGEGVVIGFIASSNTLSSNFLSFCDTGAAVSSGISDVDTATSSAYALGNEFARVYHSTDSYTASMGFNDRSLGTTYEFPAPIRVKRGLVVKANTNLHNIITVLFHKFGN